MENKQLPYNKFEKIYLQQIKRDDMYCLVNSENDKVIAFINLRFENQLHHCEVIAEIMEFVVDIGYRNIGIGNTLFKEACRIAENYGCSQIEVACNQLRSNTHRFYEREGMHNFHYKFSKSLIGGDGSANALGR